MTIILSDEGKAWLLFIVVFLIHCGVASVSRMQKRLGQQIDVFGLAFIHAIVTLIFTALYPEFSK